MARKSRMVAYAGYMQSKKANKAQSAFEREASIMRRIEQMKKEAAKNMKKEEN